jgi:hypothetical protein
MTLIRRRPIIKAASESRVSLAYIDTPDAPAFGSTTTIPVSAGTIEPADLAGNTDVILAAGIHINRVLINLMEGTVGAPIRFKGAGGTSNPTATKIGNNVVDTDYALGIYRGDYVEIYDMWIYGGHVIKGQLDQKAILVQNCIMEGVGPDDGFAGFSSKSDNSVLLDAYPITLKYCILKTTRGENLYIGQTVNDTFHNLSVVTVLHCSMLDAGWDTLQFSHVETLDVDHVSGLRGANRDSLSQNRIAQWQDLNGTVKNSIFTSLGTSNSGLSIIRTDGIEFYNCFFKAYGTGYISNHPNESWFTASTITGNKEIIIDNCIFYSTDPVDIELFEVYNSVCNITIKNCVISNTLSALFADNRGDKDTYSLIDGGGNVFVSEFDSIFAPTFDSIGRVTSLRHHGRGFGYRVADPTYPTFASVALSGTETQGQTLTATPSTFDPGSGVGEGTHLYQWYRADDAAGTNEAAIAGETSLTYVLASADAGKFLRHGVKARNGDYLVNDTIKYSSYTGAIVGLFDPYSDISWDIALDPADAVNIAATETWANQGADISDCIKSGGIAMPAYNAGDGDPYLQFTRTTPTRLSFDFQVLSASKIDLWVKFTVDNLTARNTLFSFGSTTTFRIETDGEINWGGTDTGVFISAGTEYVVRLTRDTDGTGTVTVNNGTPVTGLTFSTASGTNGFWSAYDNGVSFPSTHKQKEIFHLKGSWLTAGEVTNMWTWFGL